MATNLLAPVAVFAYKRPAHLAKTLASLARCKFASESAVYIFCDGAKSEAVLALVKETRAVAQTAGQWCQNLKVIEQPSNLGLSKSISKGVTSVCAEHGRVIVMEDDLEVAPNFLEYMNEALRRYEGDDRVMQVSGYMYPVETDGYNDAFFMVHASCWGWGTWQRAWQHYGFDPSDFERLKQDRKFRFSFNLEGTYPYFKMLQRQIAGEIDSWGVLWHLKVFKRQGLVLYPRKTLVKNSGHDATGTNVVSPQHDDVLVSFEVKAFPPVTEDRRAYEALCGHIFRNFVPWYRRLLRIPV